MTDIEWFGLIRFVCHLPWGIYADYGYSHWSVVEDHAELLLQPPFGRGVAFAETLAGPFVRIPSLMTKRRS